MRATETILFDLDDTLHDETAAHETTALQVATYVADRFFVDAHEVSEAFLTEVGAFYESLSTQAVHTPHQYSLARFWGRAIANFGIRDREFAGWCAYAFDQIIGRNLGVIPGVHEMLAQLRCKGVKLGLLTNGFASTHRQKIHDLGLDRSFDAFFLADEVGLAKPDPEIFRYACQRLNTSVECAVMVGDLYERDIVGANEAGLFTVWVNRSRHSLPPAMRQPDATVHTIVDIPQVLPPITNA